MSELEDVGSLLKAWHRRFYVLENCHYAVARTHRRRNYFLGVPAVLLTVFVGGSIFAALESTAEPNPLMQMSVGLLSFAAAGLSAVQTFLGYSERAEKNRIAAAHYGALRLQVEQEQALPTADEAQLRETITGIRELCDRYATESPEVPAGVYDAWHRRHKKYAQKRASGGD